MSIGLAMHWGLGRKWTREMKEREDETRKPYVGTLYPVYYCLVLLRWSGFAWYNFPFPSWVDL